MSVPSNIAPAKEDWLRIISRYSIGVHLLAASLLVSALLRVPYFQHAFTFIDEAWWAVGAKALLQGGNLYQDIWLDKQPPIFWFCALLFQAFGNSMLAIHLGSLLLVFLICALLFLLGTSFFSPAVGGTAALVYALASTMFYVPRIIGMNVESLMVVFTITAVYFFLQGIVHGRADGFLCAGLFSSFAIVTKPVAVADIALFGCLILWDCGFRGSSRLKSLASY